MIRSSGRPEARQVAASWSNALFANVSGNCDIRFTISAFRSKSRASPKRTPLAAGNEKFPAYEYGLTAGVLTGSPERGLAIAEQLEAGIVHVNDQPIHDEPQMPFGGVKDSGWGRFGISYAMEEFTEPRLLVIRS